MTRTVVTKTSFASGELDPLLYGRLDLRAQEDGAARLRNVVVHPTGGVSRRPGLAHVCTLGGVVRLASFDAPGGPFLLAFADRLVHVLLDGHVLQTLDTDWSAEQARVLSWVRWNDRLFICHADVRPRQLRRTLLGAWTLDPWEFERPVGGAGYSRSSEPFAKFVDPSVAMEIDNGTSSAIPADPGRIITLTTSLPTFTADHVDSIFRFKGRDVRITSVDALTGTRAFGFALEPLSDGKATRDWSEQAFSTARGWPATLAVFQDRLVVGGSRDLPDRIWLSKTGRPSNFDFGDGLDDEAVSFRLTGDEQHRILGIVSADHLQIFTDQGEWVVRGDPLTPTSVRVQLQTGVGSWVNPPIPPIVVDGATLFVAASGREVREFLFTDTEQAYQAADIALLSRHLVVNPIALVFESHSRRIHMVRGDGRLATATIDRNNNMIAWTLFETTGDIVASAIHGNEAWFAVKLDDTTRLVKLQAEIHIDHAIRLSSATPTTSWTGLDHLESREILVILEDTTVYRATVSGGRITLQVPARDAMAGLPFEHEVLPLPPALSAGRSVGFDQRYRPIRVVARLFDTTALRLDTGAGARAVALRGGAGEVVDAAVSVIGWRAGTNSFPWRIVQDDPVPCTVLAVTTELRMND
ncbi:MAG: hypothetical protein U1E45_22830 [Geminicoccaceae bacterium]